jgi:hypothetical protein
MTERPASWLLTRRAPVVCGVVTALLTWWVWGSLDQVPVFHDEAAYLLQAKIFASGRWTAPARPLPEFFEQYHVLVTPVLASKYWPGHSLLMVPGVWLGLAGLVPVLLSGLTGALCFALARRVSTPMVAVVTWLFWTTASGNLHWRASYFSEVTTSALWLLGWWALLDWYETGRRAALLAVAAGIGWSAITRPLTALVYAIPVGVVVVRRCYTRHSWRDLGLALALGTALVGVIPLWSARTTGDWRTTPYVLWARLYFPFTLSDRPARPLPPDMERFEEPIKDLVRSHTLAALPGELVQRTRQIGTDLWHGWRVIFLSFAVFGLFALPMAARLALATAVLLVLSQLTFAHYPGWSLYYLELQPVLALLTGLGVGVAAPRLRASLGADRLTWLAVIVGTAALPLVFLDLRASRRTLEHRQDYVRGFATLVQQIPAAKAIVFVRYLPTHNVHVSLIANDPDLARAHAWVVYDRGPDNARLLALAPDRAPYLYDEATNTLAALARPPSAR